MNESDLLKQLQMINQQANFNGAWAIVDQTGIRFQDQIGWANFEQRQPFTSTTTTAIGSLTKQFTAISILQLWEDTRLDLDDPLDYYFSGYRYGDQVTLRQLLNMTSGVPDYTDIVAREINATAVTPNPLATGLTIDQALGENIPLTQILTKINREPLDFIPGSQFAYSNTNYALLTRVIEIVSKTSYSQYLKNHLFDPLGLTATCVGTNQSEAQSYQYQQQQIVPVGRGHHLLGDGSVVMNLTDLIHYAQAVIAQRLLKPATWSLMFDLKFQQYGMGWMKLNSWFWHSGQILGYWSDFFLTPNRQLAMVWLYNISPTGEQEKQWLTATDQWREDYWSWLTKNHTN